MSESTRRVAIVGAGLAGLAAADALLRAGHEPVVLEASDLAAAIRAAAGGEVDVTIDTLWGEPAEAAMQAASRHARHVQVGQVAGLEAPARLELTDVRSGRTRHEDLAEAPAGVAGAWQGIGRAPRRRRSPEVAAALSGQICSLSTESESVRYARTAGVLARLDRFSRLT